MKTDVQGRLEHLILDYPGLEVCRGSIEAAFEVIAACYRAGGKLLLCGNGGSAADCDHIVGELMKGFLLCRRPPAELSQQLRDVHPEIGGYISAHLQGALPAISLTQNNALISAFSNDISADCCFAQQVYGYGRSGDLLVALSTSGNSKNVVNAAVMACALEIPVISLTGQRDSQLSGLASVAIQVPETETYRIQELHLPVYHALCAMIEEEFFGQETDTL